MLPLKIAVSKCLLGANVRYNAKVLNNLPLLAISSKAIHFLDFCPEVEAGLGVPRDPIDLHLCDGKVKVLRKKDLADLTEQILRAVDNFSLYVDYIDAAIVKERSPSCGLKVAVYKKGKIERYEPGLWARSLIKRYKVPIVEHENITDKDSLSFFLIAVYAYKNYRAGSIRGLDGFEKLAKLRNRSIDNLFLNPLPPPSIKELAFIEEQLTKNREWCKERDILFSPPKELLIEREL